jgi:hypothetical protein
MADEQKYTYRVRPGFIHGRDGEYTAGQTVELTEGEARGLEDKLEKVGGSTRGEVTQQSEADAAKQRAQESQVAQTTDLKTLIAQASDEQLLDLPGITKNALSKLRAWATEEQTTEDAPTSTRSARPFAEGLPNNVVSETVETVDEKPLKTTETVKSDAKG